MMIKATKKSQVEAAIEASAVSITFDEIQVAIEKIEKTLWRASNGHRHGDNIRSVIAAKNRSGFVKVQRGYTGWWISEMWAR